VIISPSDRDLILEGSDVRRKFMDSVISQMDKDFLRASIQYNKALSQRNALLKYFAANRNFDELSLAAYDEQLVNYGLHIYKKRTVFLEAFLPLFSKAYAQLTSQSEPVEVRYKSQLHEGDFQDLLKDSLSKDRMAQYSTVGLHKDDLLFDLQGYPIKKYGSQGQQKTFLVALKLAQYELLKMETGIKPILLLDDIFDKLDDSRVERLIQLVSQENYGQIFISDTHDKRTREVVERVRENFEIFNLDYE
jgi:DNA replication and repair protein RecF